MFTVDVATTRVNGTHILTADRYIYIYIYIYIKTQSVPRCKHFSSGLETDQFMHKWHKSLFSDKCKTYKYSVKLIECDTGGTSRDR
jgi:hypothetical protein